MYIEKRNCHRQEKKRTGEIGHIPKLRSAQDKNQGGKCAAREHNGGEEPTRGASPAGAGAERRIGGWGAEGEGGGEGEREVALRHQRRGAQERGRGAARGRAHAGRPAGALPPLFSSPLPERAAHPADPCSADRGTRDAYIWVRVAG